MLHRDLVASDGIHVIHSWIVADAAALAALTLLPADIGKIAYQVDTKQFWLLENDVIPTWSWMHSPVNTSELPENSNLYFTAGRVLSTVLAGLSTAAGTVVDATHTILQAIGFLQKQVSDNTTNIAANTGSISSNTTAISSNTASIGSNTSTLSSHSTAIAANAAAIAAKVGVPTGGTTGQVLAKNSNTNGDLIWNTIVSGGGTASVTVADVAPSSPTNGAMWLNTITGAFLIYVVEGAVSNWVEVIPNNAAVGALGLVACQAHSNSVVQGPLVTDTLTKVLFNQIEVYDYNNCFDLPNSRFIAPVPGVYDFQTILGRLNRTDAPPITIRYYINGALATGGFDANVQWDTISAPATLKLNTGDIVEVYTRVTAYASYSLTFARFIGKLIGSIANVYPAGYATFGAQKTGSQGPLAINVDTKLLFTGTKAWDPENVFDNVNSRFTTPVTGIYEFMVRLARGTGITDSSEVYVYLYKNGAQAGAMLAIVSGWEYIFGFSTTNINAGDVIEIYCKPTISTLTIITGQLYGKLLRAL